MRVSPGNAANAAAWAIIVALICAAIVLADVLGFVGLLILGGATWLVCVRAEMDQDMPAWGTEVFRARMDRTGSPEQRAAMFDEARTFTSPLRFFRRCGIFLAVVGLAGFVWQLWVSGSG